MLAINHSLLRSISPNRFGVVVIAVAIVVVVVVAVVAVYNHSC